MIGLQHFNEAARDALSRTRFMAPSLPAAPITSREILASCLTADEVVALFATAGISASTLSGRLVPEQRDVASLLDSIGLDLDRVRRRLPAVGQSAGGMLRLRRSVTRPLRVSLVSPASSMRFDASGRKVLEVAVWNARRHGRVATPLDLLRGVLSDGRDPINAEICSATTGFTLWPLISELTRLDASPQPDNH